MEARFADELTPYAVTARCPAGFDPVSRETAKSLLGAVEQVWALFEPRIMTMIAPNDDAEQSSCTETTSPEEPAEDATDSDA